MSRRLLARRAAVLGALVAVTRLPGLLAARTFNTDEATLAVGGRALRDGGSLYVDVIDRKPPLPFAAYALLGTEHLQLVRLAVALLILATALLLADEGDRRWGEGAGWVTGVAAVLGAAALGPADAPAANFELFALLPIAVAVVMAARGRAATAGVALAVAVLCKQPAAATIVPVAWSWWATRRWRGVGVGLAAGAVAGLVLAAPFGLRNVVEWSLLGTGGYLALDAGDLGFAAVRLVALIGLALLFWGGGWILVAAARRRADAPHAPDAPEPTASRADLDLWLLLGASLLGVVAGFRFFPHYLLQALPAVALLAGRGAARRPAWVRPALGWGIASVGVALTLAWAVAVTDPPQVEVDLARYAREHTTPDDQILVWGNEPEVYWRAHRLPAGGFTHSEFITGWSGGRRPRTVTEANVADRELYDEWIARLEADPPELVLDTAAADLRGGRWFPLQGFDALADLVRERYTRVATIEGVPVYRLRPEGRIS